MNKRSKVRGVPGVDRISDLPDQLKHDILSRLDTRDAVRTSVLSRKWKDEWVWLPCLSFNKNLLPFESLYEEFEANDFDLRREQEMFEKEDAFLKFMDEALLRRSDKGLLYTLQKLSLCVPFSRPEIASHVDLWLACAMKCGVRKLNLFVALNEHNHVYQLPESFVQHICFLTQLKLAQCKMISGIPGMVTMCNLEDLSLETVHVDEQSINSMINCGTIKKVKISNCTGFNKLEVSGAPKLEKVKIIMHELEKVVIDAKNLQTFSFERGYPPKEVFMNVVTCKSIRQLKLHGLSITDTQLSFHLSKFRFLEDLWLISCDSLKIVRFCGPNLKNLCINYCDNLRKAEIDAPNLESFMICTEMLSLSLYAPRLINVIISLRGISNHALWYSGFLKFLSNFNLSVTTVTLIDIPDMHFHISKVVRRTFVSPLWKVERVEIPMEVSMKCCNRSLAETISSILWIAPHARSIILLIYSTVVIQFHFLYKELTDEEAVAIHSCCSSLPIQCWMHSLKEVKIEGLKSVKAAKKLKVLFEHSQTLERIEGLPSLAI